ncbi:MAG: hypothetical protein ABI172_06715 [Ginsengibacter sp.]|jgi:hypothetical protein
MLIPFIEKIEAKFNLEKPIVVADSGLLLKDNIIALVEKKYESIIGARLESEPEKSRNKYLTKNYYMVIF